MNQFPRSMEDILRMSIPVEYLKLAVERIPSVQKKRAVELLSSSLITFQKDSSKIFIIVTSKNVDELLKHVVWQKMVEVIQEDLSKAMSVVCIVPGEGIEMPINLEFVDWFRGSGAHNQAFIGQNIKYWGIFRFRSEGEIRIAQELERANVLFFPKCMARLGPPNNRVNREPDFLVFDNQKWGILEIDGEPFHPPSRTVEDHKRDRLFRGHGISVVEHFDWQRCFDSPRKVVSEFLNILRKS